MFNWRPPKSRKTRKTMNNKIFLTHPHRIAIPHFRQWHCCNSTHFRTDFQCNPNSRNSPNSPGAGLHFDSATRSSDAADFVKLANRSLLQEWQKWEIMSQILSQAKQSSLKKQGSRITNGSIKSTKVIIQLHRSLLKAFPP